MRRQNPWLIEVFPLLVLITATTLLVGSARGMGAENILYTFAGNTDGVAPLGGVVFDSAGNLYGTTAVGGVPGGCLGPGCGTVFELTPASGGGWTETVLYRFLGGKDGSYPGSHLVFDAAGDLYGTTQVGGGAVCSGGEGCGTVFKLTHTASGWTESVIYAFTGGADGSDPIAGVVFDSAGNLYGTTTNQGSPSPTVFELTPTGNGTWRQTTIYTFNGSVEPSGGVVLDQSGNLYGTASSGGLYSYGFVFRLQPSNGSWTESVLHNFTSGRDGANPTAGVVFDSSGNLYGTTSAGGSYNQGVVFKLAPSIGNWKETILHEFTGANDGGDPTYGNLTVDASGHVLGVTSLGGYYEDGIVFGLTPGKRFWHEAVLYNFANGSDGLSPSGQLTTDAAGNVYGTAEGGSTGFGLVFEVIP